MQDGFVLRYRPEKENVDGLPGGEGAFLLCTFWLVDCLHLIGRTQEAGDLFERLLSLRNDLGLLSDEYDPRAKRMLGNFPQAFSHVALVNSARILGGEQFVGSANEKKRLSRHALCTRRLISSSPVAMPINCFC